MEFDQEKLDQFLKKIDQKLDSVLTVNARLLKENIELRRKNKINPDQTNPNSTTQPKSFAPPEKYTRTDSNDKKKVIMEVVENTSKFRFRGNGTFDAKEQIKTFGNASFDGNTRTWVLEPNKTIEFIKEELRKNFDFQFVE